MKPMKEVETDKLQCPLCLGNVIVETDSDNEEGQFDKGDYCTCKFCTWNGFLQCDDNTCWVEGDKDNEPE